MTWSTSAGGGKLRATVRLVVVLTVLAISVTLGMTAASATGSVSGQLVTHALHHRAAAPARRHHPAGQWIMDDKGGVVYVKYGP
jgi:hypothetical protein